MIEDRTGQAAVIPVPHRTGADISQNAAYGTAMVRKRALFALQPGHCGTAVVRFENATGITVGNRADDAAARASRGDPERAAIDEAARTLWYGSPMLIAATVTRGHAWRRG